MSYPKFDEKELEVVGEIPSRSGGQATPVLSYPIPKVDAIIAAFNRKPVWQVGTSGPEAGLFVPSIIPDNIARAFWFDATTSPDVEKIGGKDMFGIEWEYVPVVGGSIVKPGNPTLSSASELETKVVWPDIDSWDWDAFVELNKDYMGRDVAYNTQILNGFFERLISFMDFEEAAIAMIDEEDKEYVKAFFDKLSDLYIKLIDKHIELWPQIIVYTIHDDWGSQNSTFFAPEIVAEVIVPYMKKVTDFIHSKGKFADLHSCGKITKQIPNIIAAGWDSWTPQITSDVPEIYEAYGEQLIIGTLPAPSREYTDSEEDQKAKAQEYVAAYCKPDKTSNFSAYGMFDPAITQTFLKEVYKQSRLAYQQD